VIFDRIAREDLEHTSKYACTEDWGESLKERRMDTVRGIQE